ncbi:MULTISPECIES: beta strand repeat-containing protein [unclassified Paenibacillus]|uniref:beta strand repeat-containing protein n=1 Tax=unclassified Paenibacillus TaxID=185978 RepID=UPI003638839E
MSDKDQFVNDQEDMNQSRLKDIKQRRETSIDKKKKAASVITSSAVLLGSILPMMQTQTAYAATTGTLAVDKHFAAAGESVKITVTDAGTYFNKNAGSIETTQLAVVSNDDTGNPIYVTLTETTANSGIFETSLKLIDPAAIPSGPNEIKVAVGGTVTVLDPGVFGADLLSPALQIIERRDHVTGVFQTFDNSSQAPIGDVVYNSQVVRVELTDDDLNTDKASSQTKTVNLTLNAGTPGQTITLTENGLNSNVFLGTFKVGQDISPANNAPIYIEYMDDKRADNSSALTTKRLVRKEFSSSTLTVTPANAAYNEAVTVTLTDNDLNLDANATEIAKVKVSSPDDAAGFDLTLTETGINSGVFSGTFTMQDATDAGLSKIKVTNANAAVVTYNDLRDGTGAVALLTQSTTRKDHVSGTVSVDKSVAAVGETITVTVDDADFKDNLALGETITVLVTSPANPTGVNLNLTEAADTGVFTGTFSIGTSSGGLIDAVNGATVTVTYTDAITANNSINQPVTASLQRKDTMTGVVTIDRTNTGGQEIIEVTLNDTDLNTDAMAKETAELHVYSASDPIGFNLTVTETDVNTGVFKGKFKPVRTATNGAAALPELYVSAYNVNMTVDYEDAKNVGGNPQTVTNSYANLRIPAISSITAAEAGAVENGAGAGDTLTIVFDTATNESITGSNISTALQLPTGRTFGTTPTVSWSDSSTLVVTLDADALLFKGDSITIPASAGLKDAAGASAISSTSHLIDSGSFGTTILAMTSAVPAYNNTTYRHDGQYFDVVFNAPTNKKNGDLAAFSKLSVNAATLGTGGSAVWQNSSTLRVTLGTNATVVVGKVITYDTTGENLTDYSGETAAPASIQQTITGSFGSQVPIVSSITADNTASDVGPHENDTVRIVFDIPTDKATPPLSAFGLSQGTWGNSTVSWTDDKTLEIKLGTTADVYATSDYQVTIDYSQLTLKNIGGEGAATGFSTAMAIAPSFGQGTLPTAIAAVTTAAYDNTTYRQGGQSFDITFNQPINKKSGTATLAKITLNNGHTIGTAAAGASAVWQANGKLRVTLGTDATIVQNDTITYDTTGEGIQDPSLESAALSGQLNAVIASSFGSKVPAINAGGGLAATGVDAANVAGGIAAEATDTITVYFDTPTNQAIGTANLGSAVSLSKAAGGTGSFGSTATVSWDNTGKEMTIHLAGTGIDVKKGDSVVIAANALKNVGSEGGIPQITAVIGGTFGFGVLPAIDSIVATNDTGNGGANQGDKVTVYFTAVTDKPSTTSILSNISLSAGHTFGTGATAAWSLDGQSLIITLGTGATIVVGDTITIGAGAAIKDVSGELASMSGFSTITGTFGQIVQPQLSNVFATNGDGTANIAAGDTLEFVFNVPVDHSTFDPTKILITDSTGAITRTNPFGASPTFHWLDPINGFDTRLQIVFGNNPTIQMTDKVNIAASNKIFDVTGTIEISPVSNQAIGISFGVAVAPNVTNVYATNGDGKPTVGAGDQLVVVFDTPTNGGTTDLTKFVIDNSHTLGTLPTSSWSTDKLRLTITLGAGATITTADKLTIGSESGILDATNQAALPGTAALSIGGSFGVAVAPIVTNITATNGDGLPTVGAGDKLVLTLDSPSNGASVNLSALSFTGGHTLGTGATSAWSLDNLRLTIMLGTGTNIATTDTVTIAAGSGIKDEATGTKELVAQNSIIGGSFGTAVAPAITAINAINGDGKPTVGAGDQLQIIFDTPTNGGNIDWSKIIVGNSNNFGLTPTHSWSANNTHLTIVLGNNPTITTNDSISVLASSLIKDATNQVELVARNNIAITGSFGVAVAPIITNITALNGDGKPTVGPGDQLVLTLDSPSNGAAVDLTKLSFTGGHTLGTSGVTQSWSSDKLRLTITLGTGTNIVTTDKVIIAAGSGIVDGASGTKEVAAISGISILGSFGVAVAPNVTSVYAANGDGNPTIGAGDQLVVVFDTPTNGGAADLTKFVLDNSHTLGTSSTSSWSTDKYRLTITLGADAVVTTTDKLTIGSGSGIFDATNQVAMSGTPALTIGGSFGVAVAPIVTKITALNGDGLPTVGAGDKLVLTLDSPSNGAVVDLTKLSFTGGHTLGTSGVLQSWSLDNLRLTITLGTGANIASTDTVTIAAGSGIKDKETSTKELVAQTSLIGGSFGTAVAPVITAINAINGDGKPTVGAGDQLQIIFDTSTNGGNITDWSQIVVSNSHSLGMSPSYEWSANNTHLTIVLGNNPTITVGDKISVLAASGISDATNQAPLAAQSNISITGSFGEAVAPIIANITAVNGDGKPTVGPGDQLVLTLNSPSTGTVDLTKLSFTGGHTLGTSGVTQSWSSDKLRLTITLGTGTNIATTDTVTIAAGSGIVDAATGTLGLAAQSSLIEGSFGTAVAPVIRAINALNGDGKPNAGKGDELQIIFDTPTNGGNNIDLTKIAVSNSHNLGTNPTYSWSANNTHLTIVLGDNPTITKDDKINILAASGISDATNQAPLAPQPNISITGDFGIAVAPKFVSAIAVDRNHLNTVAGDDIIITFNSPTNGASPPSGTTNTKNLITVTGSTYSTIGDYATFKWSEDKLVLTVSLATYSGSVSGAVYANLQVGNILNLTNLGIKDATGTVPLNPASITLGGSFMPAILPKYTNAIATTNNRDSNTLGTIELLFGTEMDTTIPVDVSKIIVSNNHTFGTGAKAAWSSGTVLTITIKSDATVQTGDTIDLSKLNLMDSNKIAYLTGTSAIQALTGTFGVAPTVISVNASNDGANPGAGEGDKITITFASNTNGVTGGILDVSSLSSILGANAVGKWLNPRTLEITLGKLGPNPILKDNGTITLDSLNITDVTMTVKVTGTYVIGGSFGQANIPKVFSILASSADTSKTTSAISNNDILTITFDMPTNQSGELLNAAAVNQFVKFGTTANPKVLGAAYNGKWSDNGKTLTITVTDVAGSTIQIGDSITVSGLKNALGTSIESMDTLALSGIFDGRHFAIASSKMSSGGTGNLSVSITIQPVKDHAGTEVIIFELLKGTGNSQVPVQLIASQQDIVGNTVVNQSFDNITGSLTDYTVKAYLFDNITGTTGSQLLSQMVSMKIE